MRRSGAGCSSTRTSPQHARDLRPLLPNGVQLSGAAWYVSEGLTRQLPKRHPKRTAIETFTRDDLYAILPCQQSR